MLANEWITLEEARWYYYKQTGKLPGQYTMWRWTRRGKKGTRLYAVKRVEFLGIRTKKKAVDKFIERTAK